MEAETDHKTLWKIITQQVIGSNTRARTVNTSSLVKRGTHYLRASVLYVILSDISEL
jgi:hypothetical protein